MHLAASSRSRQPISSHRWLRTLAATLASLLLLGSGAATAADAPSVQLLGFDLSRASVPVDQILRGGPPRDGIPSIDSPKFVKAAAATFVKDSDTVLGLNVNGVRRAYPLNILNWHEIVNDNIGNEAIAVTFCPLCGTGIAFRAHLGGKVLKFGVSGLLYNSDLLLYDRQSESLWSQLQAEAIAGKQQGSKLELLPLTQTTWADWRKSWPDTEVLSTETGFTRDYQHTPYEGYEKSERLFFPVRFRAEGFHPKERIVGVSIGAIRKAYPFTELEKSLRKSAVLEDTIDGQKLRISYDPAAGKAEVRDTNGKLLPSVISFWFAWYAFYPQTEVFRTK